MLCSPTHANLRSVWIQNPNSGYACGDHGTALHWDGNAWKQLPTPTNRNLYAVDGGVFVGERGVALEWSWVNRVIPSQFQAQGTSTTAVVCVGCASWLEPRDVFKFVSRCLRAGVQYPNTYVEPNPSWHIIDEASW